MKKKFLFIVFLFTPIFASCGKHTDSVCLELKLANKDKTTQDSILQDNLILVLDTINVLGKIVKHTNNIVEYVKPVFWKKPEFIAVFALIISFVACIGTCLGARWQKKAENNTRAILVKKEQQTLILSDFIRHIYRNKVIICALQWQLDKKGYEYYYPSDEHILKLRIPFEELQLDSFTNTIELFEELHRLKLLCRNTNIEMEVAYEHLKIKEIQTKYKKESLQILEFKCQLLTKSIIKFMYNMNLLKESKEKKEMKLDVYEQEIKTLLCTKIQNSNQDESPTFEEYIKDEKYRTEEKKYQREGRRYRYYDDELKIGEQLSYDIYMEGEGKNEEKGVIRLIEFRNNG